MALIGKARLRRHGGGGRVRLRQETHRALHTRAQPDRTRESARERPRSNAALFREVLDRRSALAVQLARDQMQRVVDIVVEGTHACQRQQGVATGRIARQVAQSVERQAPAPGPPALKREK